MRKIVFYGAISLDGFLADEEDDLQWLLDTNLGGKSTYEAFEEQISTFVMGRKTFEIAQQLMGQQALYAGKEKVVFSRHNLIDQKDITYVSGDVVSIIKKYQQQSGDNIWIIGGGSILKPLLEANMIDEFWIQIVPILLGQGKRLFEPGNYRYRLQTVDTTQLGEMTEIHLKKVD
ncbi:dihydrofolate reductase family protein [Leuconostoc rapi]|uniref:dihydrofolate reductase family protein n=1 Tax=Leuconostoc rapi TaxID=1406906 RepID=UPI00195D1988|nr:dihydrofolate reductase family protein [Leuconostoc rapi]MBM7435363.1 dihydrofolate reductase [Leuconostoc rapi]